MDENARLSAAEAIRNLKGRYCIAVDTKDAELFRSLFAADTVVDYSGAVADPASGEIARASSITEVLRGPHAVTASVMNAVAGMVSVHHCATGDIRIDSPDRARATWPIVDRLRYPPGGEVRELTGYGFYHETYVREDGEWKISTLTMSRLRIDVVRA
jgi:hypothetical protein